MKVKSQQGLSKHQRTSERCIRLQRSLESKPNKTEDSKPSALKPGPTEKRKGVLDQEQSEPAAKRTVVLDNVTMQKLVLSAGGDKALLETLAKQALRNPVQVHQASIACLPYARPYNPESSALFGLNNDSSSDQGIPMDEEEGSDEVEESSAEGDETEESGEESVAFGQDADSVVTDDEASAAVPETLEELNSRMARRAATWNRFDYYQRTWHDSFGDLSESEVRAIRIMRTLIKKRAPLDTYPDVMAWHLREIGLLGHKESVGQSPDFISRDKLMKMLRKRYHMEHQYALPVTICLPHSKSKVAVWKKLAQDNVLSLLTDPRWKDDDWLYFEDNPFAKPPDDYPFISDLNTGDAYQETWRKLITKPNQILVAIPLYIDGAVTGQFDKLQVTALKMTIGLLNRRARDKEHAWRSLGFVTNYTKEDTGGKRIFVRSGHVAAHELYVDGISDDEEDANGPVVDQVDKAADYHAILDVLLGSLKDLIADGMVVDIAYKGVLYPNCELVFFVPFVKCDGDEGDKLCGSFRSRGKDISQLCRHCLCPTDETDDPNAIYPFKTEPMIRKMFLENNAQKHKELSQIPIKNAFHLIRFGLHNVRGIHGATPWELLHGILLGHFKYIRDCFFDQMGETSITAKEVNALAQEIGRLLQRQSDRNKPRTKFAKGILKGKLMAKEYAGVLLVMAALLQTQRGKEMITGARKKQYRQSGQISDWVLLVELMLQWEGFLNLAEMEKKDIVRLKRKHKYLLFLLKRVGNRNKGMGFKIMKFHAVLHLAMDIMMFGVPMVVDTGSNESHHKTTKIAAKLTQKDVQTFEKQTSDRLDDFHVLDLAMEEVNGRPLCLFSEANTQPGNPVVQDKPSRTGGMIINVFRDKTNQQPVFTVKTRMKDRKAVPMDEAFLAFCLAIQEDIAQHVEGFVVPICAEHKRGGIMFRSHPNYRGKGPWRDFVMIAWDSGDYPAQIWGYLDLSALPPALSVPLSEGLDVHQGVWAVIESYNYVALNDNDRQSEIFKPIILDTYDVGDDGVPDTSVRKYYLVDVSSFMRPLVVIPNIGTQCEYLMMTPKVQWGEDFRNWLREPHANEDREMKDTPPRVATRPAGRPKRGDSSDDSEA
jgi:hypothetical protein